MTAAGTSWLLLMSPLPSEPSAPCYNSRSRRRGEEESQGQAASHAETRPAHQMHP